MSDIVQQRAGDCEAAVVKTTRDRLIVEVVQAARAWRSRTNVRAWDLAVEELIKAVDDLNCYEREAQKNAATPEGSGSLQCASKITD